MMLKYKSLLVAGSLLLSSMVSANCELSIDRVLKVYDGDTIHAKLKSSCGELPDVFGKKMGIRVFGIDTPEIRGSKCRQEKILATEAKMLLKRTLLNADKVELVDVRKGKYFRLVADVLVDGVSVTYYLFEEGLAVPYFGGTKTMDWCGAIK